MVKAYEENGRGEEEDEDEDEVVEAEEEEAEEEAVEADEPGARTRRMKRRAAKAGTRARTEDLAMVAERGEKARDEVEARFEVFVRCFLSCELIGF